MKIRNPSHGFLVGILRVFGSDIKVFQYTPIKC